MTRAALNSGDRLPSPPPPPVISNGPAIPQVAAIAPLVVGESSKPILGDNGNEFSRENQVTEGPVRERDAFELNRGRFRRSWTDIKVKPEAEIKPLPLSSQLELEIDSRKVRT